MSKAAPIDTALEQTARDVRKNAHAPYSKYKVGAAVRTASGRVFAGVNVENRSFGLTICAERNAIAAAVAAGEKKMVAMAIATRDGAAPCGACRQVMAEFNWRLPVTLLGARSRQNLTLEALLPLPFEGP